MSFPKVTLGILVYRSIRYLPYFLPSLMAQNYPNLEILIPTEKLLTDITPLLKK